VREEGIGDRRLDSKSSFSRCRMSACPLNVLPQSIEIHVYLVDSAFERTEVLERVLSNPYCNGKSRSQTECCEEVIGPGLRSGV